MKKRKGIVKYTERRTYNIGQAFQDGFGIKWKGENSVVGLKLKDRKKSRHKVQIVRTDWFMGIFRVFYQDGSWQCFDHCIEQFELA